MGNARRIAVALGTVGIVAALVLFARAHRDPDAATEPVDAPAVEPALADTELGEIELELHECETTDPAGTCHMLPSRELSLWARGPVGSTIELRVDGARVEPVEEVQGGVRYAMTLAPDTRRLELRATHPRGVVVRTLAMGPPERPAWYYEADVARDAGELDRAAAIITPHLDEREDHIRAWALYAMGRVELRRDHHVETRALWHEAGELLARSGRPLDAASPLSALAFTAAHEGHFAEARAVLARIDELVGPVLIDKGSLDTVLGARKELAAMTGELRDDMRLGLERAAVMARHGDTAMRAYRLSTHASALAELGRAAEAEATLHEVVAALDRYDVTPQDRASVLTSLGWSRLVRLEAGEPAEDPTPMFEEAVALHRANIPTFGTYSLVNDLINLGLAHVISGRTADARAAADEARRLLEEDDPDHWLAYWVEYVDAATAMSERRHDVAISRYERLARAGEVLGSELAVWRAHVGRAEALHARGDDAAAIDALIATERELDDVTLRAPFDEGREGFVAQRERGTRLLVELLVAAGRIDEAIAVARAARTRVLRSVVHGARAGHLDGEARRRWDERLATYRAARTRQVELGARHWEVALNGDGRFAVELDAARDEARRALASAFETLEALQPFEPRPIAPGELGIVLFPTTRSWVAFAIDASGARAHHVEPSDGRDPRTLATALLTAMLPLAREATRVRLMAHGALRDLDLHALPLGSESLIDLADVTYALDLARTPSAPGEARAWVVADPRGDLPAARQEAERVAGTLGAGAWSVRSMRGGEVTRAALERALAESSLVHFAGHGRFDAATPWESALVLAEDETLTAGDIVALRRVPARVVLSSCDATRTRAGGTPESISLATAFVLAGSEQVVGATRPLADAALVDLMTEVHRGSGDLAARLRRAVLAVRERARDLDWRALRVVEP